MPEAAAEAAVANLQQEVTCHRAGHEHVCHDFIDLHSLYHLLSVPGVLHTHASCLYISYSVHSHKEQSASCQATRGLV